MRAQQANGIFYPSVPHQELFRMENPRLHGVVFLRDMGTGGDVKIYTAPATDGAPGSFTLRHTVTLGAKAMKVQTLPVQGVYIRIEPVSNQVEFDFVSMSPFHYSRHLP